MLQYVRISAASLNIFAALSPCHAVTDSGFESYLPLITGDFVACPTSASPWSGAGGCFYAKSLNAPWGDIAAADCRSVFTVLQGSASVQQQLTSLQVGVTYQLSWMQRGRAGALGLNNINVYVGGALLYSELNIADTGVWVSKSAVWTATTSTAVLLFQSTNPAGGDHTVFIDAVAIKINLPPTASPTLVPTSSPTLSPTASPTSSPSAANQSIVVVSANYGGNCAAYNSIYGSVVQSQVSSSIRFLFANVISDPAFSCAKDLTIQFRVGSSPAVITSYTQAEAGGKWVQLLLDRPSLTITRAIYGENCGISSSNRVAQVQALVASSSYTTATFVWQKASTGGDPAPGCSKDLNIQYQCSSSNAIFTRYISAEADGQLITLPCKGINGAWTDLASEGGTFSTTASQAIRFGSSASWAPKWFAAAVTNFVCSASNFGVSLQGCQTKESSTLQCWGNNELLQSTVPLALQASNTVAFVSAGYGHTCVVKTSGDLSCFGANSYGQATPPAPSSVKYTQVSSGQYHSCAITTTGGIVCWGNNAFQQRTCFSENPSLASMSFVFTSVGYYHTCALGSTGSIFCCGRNVYGESSPPSGIFSQLTSGLAFSCAINSYGLSTCWGDNSYGQFPSSNVALRSIAAGLYGTCTIDETGSVACFGYNNPKVSPYSGLPMTSSQAFMQVSAGGIEFYYDAITGELSTVVGGFACGLAFDKSLKCIGLGVGGVLRQLFTVPRGISFSQLSVGRFTICGVSTDNFAYCWGTTM